ncbi:MAG: hypothetical protein AAFW76_09155, partial [Pseudomonadota bacterium]
MTSTLQASVVEDRNAPDDGYAIIRVTGVVQKPDIPVVITLEREAPEAGFLGTAGWQDEPVSLALSGVVRRGDMLDLLIGPEITGHVAAGSSVRLSIDGLGFDGGLTWPGQAAEPPTTSNQTLDVPAPGPLAAPSDHRRPARSAARVGPTATRDGSRQEPRLGRADGPGPLSATKPTRPRPALGSGRPQAPARQAPRAEPMPSAGAAEATLPWEWSDQTQQADGNAVDGGLPASSDRPRGDSPRSARYRRVPLPWRIVGVNLIILVVLGAVGYAMVFNGWDPVRMFTGSPDEQASAGRDGPSIQALPREEGVDAMAAMRQRALDALAVAITGPVGETRMAIEGDANPAQLFDLARSFQTEGDPGTALALFDYAALQGNGAAAWAIGRMADPVHFETVPTAFTRPNAELA